MVPLTAPPSCRDIGLVPWGRTSTAARDWLDIEGQRLAGVVFVARRDRCQLPPPLGRPFGFDQHQPVDNYLFNHRLPPNSVLNRVGAFYTEKGQVVIENGPPRL